MHDKPKDDEMLSVFKAAEHVGCDVSTIRRALGKGQIKHARKVGNYWILYRSDVDKWAELFKPTRIGRPPKQSS